MDVYQQRITKLENERQSLSQQPPTEQTQKQLNRIAQLIQAYTKAIDNISQQRTARKELHKRGLFSLPGSVEFELNTIQHILNNHNITDLTLTNDLSPIIQESMNTVALTTNPLFANNNEYTLSRINSKLINCITNPDDFWRHFVNIDNHWYLNHS